MITAAAMLASDGGQGQDAARLAAAVIADELTARSLDVRSPGWDGSQFLKVANVPGKLCQVSVGGDGAVEWECWPCEGRETDPACTAAAVLRILGADADADADAGPTVTGSRICRCGVSFKGAAGRILAGHGMQVAVRAYPDQEFFEVYSEIEAANPARPERGMVRVADDGSILWRCCARMQPDDIGSLDPAQIAGMIAQALSEGHRPGMRPAHATSSPCACPVASGGCQGA